MGPPGIEMRTSSDPSLDCLESSTKLRVPAVISWTFAPASRDFLVPDSRFSVVPSAWVIVACLSVSIITDPLVPQGKVTIWVFNSVMLLAPNGTSAIAFLEVLMAPEEETILTRDESGISGDINPEPVKMFVDVNDPSVAVRSYTFTASTKMLDAPLMEL